MVKLSLPAIRQVKVLKYWQAWGHVPFQNPGQGQIKKEENVLVLPLKS